MLRSDLEGKETGQEAVARHQVREQGPEKTAVGKDSGNKIQKPFLREIRI